MHPKTAARLRALMVSEEVGSASSRSVLVLARGLAVRGHEVAVASLAGAPVDCDMEVDGVSVIRAPAPSADLDGAGARTAWLRSVVARFAPDVIHAYGAGALLAASNAVTPGGGALLATLQLRAGSADPTTAAAAACAHALIAPTAEEAARLCVSTGCEPDRVHAIPPAVCVDPGDSDARRQPRPGRMVGVISDLVPEARVDVFLRAVPRMITAAPDVTYVIVGDGPERSGLECLAERLEIRERVGFLHERGDMSSILRRLDVLCLPGTSPAAPYAALEGMALGTPIVAAAAGGITHLVRHCREALIVRQGDAEALAAEARSLLERRLLARRLAWAARRRLRRRFSLARIVALHEDLYAASRRAAEAVVPDAEPLPLAVSA